MISRAHEVPGATLIVGIDPGITCGVCEFKVGESLPQLYSLDPEGLICKVEELISRAENLEHLYLVVEKFLLYPSRAAGQSLSTLVTAEEIGVIKYLVSRQDPNRVSLAIQTAAQVKPWANEKTLFSLKFWNLTPEFWKKSDRHAHDAARHLAYFVMNGRFEKVMGMMHSKSRFVEGI